MTAQAFPLVEVAGSPYEMGYQHGAQARHLIQRYLLWIERLTRRPRDVLCRNAMTYLPMIEALSQPLAAEIQGLAAGAGITLAEAVLCQARGEAGRAGIEGCTSFALTGSATLDGQPLVGQNIDLQPEFAEVAILLRVTPDDGRPSALMFTMAGQLGYQGMNRHGVTHFANGLFDYAWRPGLPHYPLKRALLEQRTVGQCVDLMARHRTCSAGNVALADGEGAIADVEFRPEGVAQVAGDPPDCLLHTNHYLAPEFAAYETHSVADSRARLARIRALVTESWGRITVETLQAILADHQGDPTGICRHGSGEGGPFHGFHSIAGFVAEPARRLLHIRSGHGCLGTWRTYKV